MADQFQPPTGGMVQCEVTGKWVPPDQIVVFHGKRVCAEGKQRILEMLKAGEMLPGELERPTVMRRFGCMFADGLVLGFTWGLVAMIFGVGAFFSSPSPLSDRSVLFTQGLLGIIGAGVYIAYYGLMHGMWGQTLGKMAGKLKVVMRDGSPANMRTTLLRAVYFIGPNILPSIGFLFVGFDDVTGMMVVQFANILVGAYTLANIIFALIDRTEQRAIHDRLAGTRVIVVS